MSKSTWRLRLDLAYQYDPDFDWETVETEDYTLHFDDEVLALEALEEAKVAEREEWVDGVNGYSEPGVLRLGFCTQYNVVLWDEYGSQKADPLALYAIREFIKVEQLYPEA